MHYARLRATETKDVILRLHYLEYCRLQGPQPGREWIEVQRELLETYRDYVEGCRAGAPVGDEHGIVGVDIEHALDGMGPLLARAGVLRQGEATDWADWLIRLAEASRAFPVREPNSVAQQRHRWVAPFLSRLADLPPDEVSREQRQRALDLIREAGDYYRSTPLNDDFERLVAEVNARLRKRWGERDTHRAMVREHFDSLVRRARFHEGTGNGLLTSHFVREARRLAEDHRQYFDAREVADLETAEQAAIQRAIDGGEFKTIEVPITIPSELMDFTRGTAEETVQALVDNAIHSVPNRETIARHVEESADGAPLQALIARSVVGAGKIVGESRNEAENRVLEIENRAMLQTRLLGAAVATTVVKAGSAGLLTPEYLVGPLAALGLDEGTTGFLRHACERFIAQDFVSATHILVPHVEDVLRQHLRQLGVDTTEFRRDVGDGTSRTDDASLGSLMRKSLPDGRSVRDYLGADLWEHLDSVLNSQTGMNLRNDFAHGLARSGHCSPEVAGIALALLYQLAHAAHGGVEGAAARTSVQ